VQQIPGLPPHAVIVAFEGPDRYSLVGGLGVRVTQLAAALGDAGVATDLLFIGDPQKPPIEETAPNVRLRRWSQWISQHHAASVYDGEAEKIADLVRSAPPVIASEIVLPAQQRGLRTLILGEDWQIAPVLVALDEELTRRRLRQSAVLLWNANNTYGFERIAWPALARAAHITAVSKYMKFELAQHGAAALVIPNGIPQTLLEQYDEVAIEGLRAAWRGRHALLKVGRFDADKRWMQAVDAVSDLRQAGVPVQLVVRGGKERYGESVLRHAHARGLTMSDITLSESSPRQLADALARTRTDVAVLRSFLPDATLYALYGAVDAVLANSGKEPFGLVGLEVMAAGGIPVCGSTGEDYAEPFSNAIVCDTAEPRELAAYLQRLFGDSALASRIRVHARETAARYTWPNVLQTLAAKLAYLSTPATP
jgi:glycosyltransferase involved in cell wall biosynthesis